MRTARIKQSLFGGGIAAALAVFVWATDEITLQGERTIYTVDCEHGLWEDLHCTGMMVAGARYRFRASQSRNEVIVWVAGSSTPSGKYTDCSVKNRGNWSCKPAVDVAPSITFEMMNDRATHGPAYLTIPFHAVAKWKWWLMRAGIRAFNEAGY